jgi:hypothetical protein
MGRKVSVGIVGSGSGLGTIVASGAGNTLTTVVLNQNLNIDPNGTGTVDITGDTNVTGDITIANQGDLRLREASGNGTNYIAMQAASNMAANYTITWPAAVSGTAGFVLSSDTNGGLSWVSAGGAVAVTDPGSTATVHYPLFGTASGSLPTTLAPLARTNLSFVPSTGELFSTIARHPDVIGSASNSATITIRGTTSATKATASVLMTDGVASTTTGTGTLVVTGGVGISGQITVTSIVETSSIAFKENVNPIENALNTVLQLIGVTYDRKDGSSVNEAGLIAEEVYKIAPNLVSLDKEGNPYGLHYTKLTAYLIESIKSLKNEINDLKVTSNGNT